MRELRPRAIQSPIARIVPIVYEGEAFVYIEFHGGETLKQEFENRSELKMYMKDQEQYWEEKRLSENA